MCLSTCRLVQNLALMFLLLQITALDRFRCSVSVCVAPKKESNLFPGEDWQTKAQDKADWHQQLEKIISQSCQTRWVLQECVKISIIIV